MHELVEKEDPYSWYRGQSAKFVNLTPKERVIKALLMGVPVAAFLGLGIKWYLEEKEKSERIPELGESLERHTIVNWSGTHKARTDPHTLSTSLICMLPCVLRKCPLEPFDTERDLTSTITIRLRPNGCINLKA
jgi:hypothetical protein